MRIAVVALGDKPSEKLLLGARAAAREFSMMGHAADFFENADTRLSSYDFVAACAEPRGIRGPGGAKLGEQLSACGNLVGRRSMALVFKQGLFPQKALSLFMKALEREGMVVTMGEVLADSGAFAAAAREAPLLRG